MSTSFTHFTIENFKCFRKKQTLCLATPHAGKLGSGLTYIVGANNSGKTTLIEGLSIKEKHRINSSERVHDLRPGFSLFEGDNLARRCALIREESYTIAEEPVLPPEKVFHIVSSRRHWESTAGTTFRKLGDGFEKSTKFERRHNVVEVASELKTIEGDTTRYAEFISLVQRVVPEFTKFAVGYEDREYIEYISGSGDRHKSDLLGDGVITAIRILLHLYIDDPNPLIIDEPELSLHPAAQKRLLKVIAERATKRQIVISTHSPYFIHWEYLRNGAVLNRIVKSQDMSTQISSVTDVKPYEALLSGANWQQPFLLDEVAKELFFFSDKVLFLEGQEDVGLLRTEPLVDAAHIFGYGVRGKDNFQFALRLASDLGFEKVCCILDAGEEERKVADKLRATHPTYKILQWNKSDIRDKQSVTTKEKEGYFTVAGVKKESQLLDDFDKKCSEIGTYFNTS